MATIADLEARVLNGEAAIKAREASGRPVPPKWYDTYAEAWVELLDTAAREPAPRGPLVQAAMPISAGVR